jgi:hypothetical protein
MTMLAEMTFSDARSKFTSIIASLDMVNDLITESSIGPKFQVEFIAEVDGSMLVTLDPFELVVAGKDKKEAVENLINEMTIYAEDYMKDFALYRSSKNRRDHFPLVFRILSCNTKEQIKGLIGIA